MKIQIIVPIYYPDHKFRELLQSIKRQTVTDFSLLIIDSGSDGGCKKWIAGIENANIEKIDAATFNHGGTRQMAIRENPDKDVYVFLTQDAILAREDAIEKLVDVFADARIGCAYGRQLPHKDANQFASFARAFNYGGKSNVRFFADRKRYGIKTAFISNSFAAYRKEAIEAAGGFPRHTILSEDMYLAAKMLLKGWGVAYVAEAEAYHSHNYTAWQEFQRYFDIGVFQSREKWIRETFGEAEQEGGKFVKEELKALMPIPWKIAEMIIRDGMKYAGYRLGFAEKRLPVCIKKSISMTKGYW